MPKFTIAVTWISTGEYRAVEADSLEDAKAAVLLGESDKLNDLPRNGDYVDDSMRVYNDECYQED